MIGACALRLGLGVALLGFLAGLGCAPRRSPRPDSVPSREAAGGSGSVGSVAIPFVRREGGPDPYPIVRASIAGRDFLFLVDTGAFGVLLPPATVAALGARDRLPALRLGGETLTDLTFVQVPNFRIADGDLGRSFLEGRIVQFDFPRRTVTFFEASERKTALGPRPPPGLAFNQLPGRHEIFLSVSLEDRPEPVVALFDSGGSQAKIAHDELSRLGPRAPTPVPDSVVVLTRIGIPTTPTPTVLTDVETYLSRPGDRGWRSKSPATLQLGCKELADFVVTVDYPAGMLYFERRPSMGQVPAD
jgi:hypothetical protein